MFIGIFIVCVVVVVGSIGLLVASFERARINSIEAMFEGRGFSFGCSISTSESDSLREQFHHALEHHRGRRQYVKWVARGSVEGVPVLVFEEWRRVGGGKSSHWVRQVISSIEIDRACPRLSIVRRGLVGQIGAAIFGVSPKSSGTEAFHATWKVESSDDGLIAAVITPEFAERFAGTPGTVSWHLGHGHLCQRLDRNPHLEAITYAVSGPVEFLKLLPPGLARAAPSRGDYHRA